MNKQRFYNSFAGGSTVTHASLFSGIGGFDLAAEWHGWENIFSCEKDEKANRVLQKQFPDVIHHRDIFELDGTQYQGQIDVLTGGFPCQPFSLAGKRKGENDDRYLWPEMHRIIREVKPAVVVGENVYGLVNMENGSTLEKIYTDLESEGYKVESFIIPACAVQAWHRRDRIWIIAYLPNARFKGVSERAVVADQAGALSQSYSHNRQERDQRRKYKAIPELRGIQRGEDGRIYANITERSDLSTPVLCRSDDGVPKRMERVAQYGNAIVPQVAYEIFEIIAEAGKKGIIKTYRTPTKL